jgi:hypothetical protein
MKDIAPTHLIKQANRSSHTRASCKLKIDPSVFSSFNSKLAKSEQITLYGYQQQQFCKMPCFCIPAYENKRIFTAIFLG